MGKPNSKTTQEGVNNININEHLDNNQQLHEAHEVKLYLSLALNVLQVLWIIHKQLKKKWRRQGFSRAVAVSRENLETIRVDK